MISKKEKLITYICTGFILLVYSIIYYSIMKDPFVILSILVLSFVMFYTGMAFQMKSYCYHPDAQKYDYLGKKIRDEK